MSSIQTRRAANHFVYAGRQGAKRALELAQRKQKEEKQKAEIGKAEMKKAEWNAEQDLDERERRDAACFQSAAKRICDEARQTLAGGQETVTMAAHAAGGAT